MLLSSTYLIVRKTQSLKVHPELDIVGATPDKEVADKLVVDLNTNLHFADRKYIVVEVDTLRDAC